MAILETQVLSDTPRRYVAKRINVGNTETASVFVNAAALGYSVSVLTLDAGSNNFTSGECINAASGGSAWVQSMINSTAVAVINASGTFTAATVLTGNTSGRTRVQSGSIATTAKNLAAQRIVYSIGGPLDAKLQLDWEGSPAGATNNRALVVLSGQGVLELDTHGARANNNATNATGNILVTTLNWTANSHYTLVLDLAKGAGYEPVTLDSNY